MVREMMTRNKNFKIIFTIFLILFLPDSILKADEWIVAAQKFELTRGQTDSVSNALASMLPGRILDNLGRSNFRTILKDEQYERELYDLKKSQSSLFLQLSSEIQKRDALITANYSASELNKKLAESEKKIEQIQTKIDEAKEKRVTLKNELLKEDSEVLSADQNTNESYTDFFKNLFSAGTESLTTEKIAFYKNDFSALYTPDQSLTDPTSYEFEKKIVAAKINSLITGYLTIYGEYMSLTVEVYSYPGRKKIATVTEVGSISDADFVCSNIAHQLVPSLTNSLPVILNVQISPKNANLYIDDVLQTDISDKIVIDSGVHSIQFNAPDYRTVGTNYYFKGNQTYSIEVSLIPDAIGNLSIDFPTATGGSFFANGELYSQKEDQSVQIKINGQPIMGQFFTVDGNNAFVYVNQNQIIPDNSLVLNTKFLNRNEYIEKRRRMMYTSYSALMISLIPLFYTNGVYNAYANAPALDSDTFKKAQAWTVASNVCSYVSLGMGGWFIFEFVRYLKAADSVLPYEAKNNNDKKKTKKDSE